MGEPASRFAGPLTCWAISGTSNGAGQFNVRSLFPCQGFRHVRMGDLSGAGRDYTYIYQSTDAAMYTGLSTGNPANPLTYLYSYWGLNKRFAQ